MDVFVYFSNHDQSKDLLKFSSGQGYRQHIQVKYTAHHFLFYNIYPDQFRADGPHILSKKQNTSFRSKIDGPMDVNFSVITLVGKAARDVSSEIRLNKSAIVLKRPQGPKAQGRYPDVNSAGVLPLEVQSRIANVAAWYTF